MNSRSTGITKKTKNTELIKSLLNTIIIGGWGDSATDTTVEKFKTHSLKL